VLGDADDFVTDTDYDDDDDNDDDDANDDDDDDDDDDDSDDVNHSMTKNVNYTYRGKNCMETWHIQKERLISRLEPEGR